MNTLNPTAAKFADRLPPLNLRRPFLSKPTSPLSFRFRPQPLPLSSISTPIRAASQSSNPSDKPPKIHNPKFPHPLKITIAAAAAAAALVFSRLNLSHKQAIASPSPSPAVETAEKDSVFPDAETERSIEEHLLLNHDDPESLKTLMEVKIKSGKVSEAVEIIEKLMVLEPEEAEWPMMRAHLYAHSGDVERAKNVFQEILEKDPFRVEAYHGLVTVASQEESTDELKDVENRVNEAIKLCKKENRGSDIRDFKLLIAQIKVIDSQYEEALRLYQELVKEEPRDFRPYLCKGIIYTLLRKDKEAEENFEKYRRLLPKGHPYASYFDDNMFATKFFAQKVENERVGSKN